jgi:hypothetical protein
MTVPEALSDQQASLTNSSGDTPIKTIALANLIRVWGGKVAAHEE